MRIFTFYTKFFTHLLQGIFFLALHFFYSNCTTNSFQNLPENKSQEGLRLTFQLYVPNSFQAVHFKPVRFLWPKGKEEKIWNESDVFTRTNQHDLKVLLEKGIATGFGITSLHSDYNENPIFAILPLNIMVAEQSAVGGEFAFYFRKDANVLCKERLSLFLKGDHSDEELKWVLSKASAYLSVFFISRCITPNASIPKSILVYSSFIERPWDYIKNHLLGTYQPYSVEFAEANESILEKFPKEMKYQECVQYGNTASGGVRCIYSEQRTVRDIDWKKHWNAYPDFRWDWVLSEKKETTGQP
ncbi:hypothetical protein EHQ05_00775 [Leptospira yasudae]|nr:hypothetical protein EHQ05_00775 [Leptospira yasudae]TGM06691.1 hypothetical protein EHQ86_07200 [Leptospira yasudae]